MIALRTERAALAPAREPPPQRDAVGLVAVHAGVVSVRTMRDLPTLLGAGDLLVVNDAATWPASLRGRTATGAAVELRLVTGAFGPGAVVRAVLFGAGDWRTPTEHRPPPPRLDAGDRIAIDAGPTLLVERVTSPRLVEVRIPDDDAGFAALYAAGRPVQYAHLTRPLAAWDVQTAYAGRPWAVEMPSAGRPLSWDLLVALAARGIAVASLTHAAGLSSTGDAELDASLPWREHYDIPETTARAVIATRAAGGRVIAVGTTVVRALESAARDGTVLAGAGDTELLIDAAHRRAIVDGILSGLHDPSESHFRLLEAFAPRPTLIAAWTTAIAHGLRGHELGDSLLVLDLAT